jgi:hypothetical protein
MPSFEVVAAIHAGLPKCSTVVWLALQSGLGSQETGTRYVLRKQDSRMRSITSMLRFLPSRRLCPLCGGSKAYRVWNKITYAELRAALNNKQEWLAARGVIADQVPNLPTKLAAKETTTLLPGLEEKNPRGRAYDDEEHRRCRECHSLLPPQFWRPELASQAFSLAVLGYGEVGKTTWLTSMLTPPANEMFEVVRKSDSLLTHSYDYAEPYTIGLLREMRGARTLMAWTLLGTTIKRGDRERILVRTLDMRGEHLRGFETEARGIINRHLTMRGNHAALLVVDRYAGPTLDRTDSDALDPTVLIGRVFQDLKFPWPDWVWSGVVWTYLDKAAWTEETAAWLRQHVPDVCDALIDLGSTNPVLGADLYKEWRSVVRHINETMVQRLFTAINITTGFSNPTSEIRLPRHRRTLIERLMNMRRRPTIDRTKVDVSDDPPPSGKSLEGLIALLFRLQIAYSLQAGAYKGGKDAYYRESGERFCAFIMDLARELYVLWDRPRGAMGQLIRTNAISKVFPCGMVGGENGVSVWSDLILLEVLAGTRVSS